MLTIGDISAKIDKLLINELDTTIHRISQNMERNNQVVSGRTVRSMESVAKDMIGAIYGAEHIDTLETGITPERSKSEAFVHKYRRMFDWGQAKFGMTKQHAYLAAVKQEVFGSVLHRLGGRTDVWTSEEQPLMESLKERVAELLINEKWLE